MPFMFNPCLPCCNDPCKRTIRVTNAGDGTPAVGISVTIYAKVGTASPQQIMTGSTGSDGAFHFGVLPTKSNGLAVTYTFYYTVGGIIKGPIGLDICNGYSFKVCALTLTVNAPVGRFLQIGSTTGGGLLPSVTGIQVGSGADGRLTPVFGSTTEWDVYKTGTTFTYIWNGIVPLGGQSAVTAWPKNLLVTATGWDSSDPRNRIHDNGYLDHCAYVSFGSCFQSAEVTLDPFYYADTYAMSCLSDCTNRGPMGRAILPTLHMEMRIYTPKADYTFVMPDPNDVQYYDLAKQIGPLPVFYTYSGTNENGQGRWNSLPFNDVIQGQTRSSQIGIFDVGGQVFYGPTALGPVAGGMYLPYALSNYASGSVCTPTTTSYKSVFNGNLIEATVVE